MALEITDSNFEETVLKSDKPVMVDFWAAWCGPCRMVGPIIDELSEEYEGKAIIGKVDIDSAELIATTQNTTRINARKTRVSGNNIDIGGKTNITLITSKGAIKVKKIVARDVNWATQVFAGTAVPSSALNTI